MCTHAGTKLARVLKTYNFVPIKSYQLFSVPYIYIYISNSSLVVVTIIVPSVKVYFYNNYDSGHAFIANLYIIHIATDTQRSFINMS